MREVTSANWVAEHSQLLAQGFARFEFLTAVHLGGTDFEVISKVSKADLSETEIFRTQVTGQVESVTAIYPQASFHEREVLQMLGLGFTGLADSSPAFNVEFDGYPLRKDFALNKRANTDWPGAVEPDEKARRRPSLPPGVFETWSK